MQTVLQYPKQVSDPQQVSARVCVCVCACVWQINKGMLKIFQTTPEIVKNVFFLSFLILFRTF